MGVNSLNNSLNIESENDTLKNHNFILNLKNEIMVDGIFVDSGIIIFNYY